MIEGPGVILGPYLFQEIALKNAPANPTPLNIAELSPTKRAIADQSIRECLLAIVVAQGKPVTIPIAELNRIAAVHRLIIGVDHEAGVVILTTEAAKLVQDITPPALIKH